VDYFFLGDAELVTAFNLIGINGVAVLNADRAVNLFRHITGTKDENAEATEAALFLPEAGNLKVLIMTEEVAHWLGSVLINWQLECRYPLIVEIPGILGHMSQRKKLVDSIREAIGLQV